jgi:hypothetical protein
MTGELPDDLFERLLYQGRVRIQAALREPSIYRLFFNTFLNALGDIIAELQRRFSGYYTVAMRDLYAGLDLSKFREGTDVGKVIELVFLMLEGLYSKYTQALQRLQPAESRTLIDRRVHDPLDHGDRLCGVFQITARALSRSHGGADHGAAPVFRQRLDRSGVPIRPGLIAPREAHPAHLESVAGGIADLIPDYLKGPVRGNGRGVRTCGLFQNGGHLRCAGDA